MVLLLWLRASALIALLVGVVLLLFLLQQSWPFWHLYGLKPLITSDWYPYEKLFGLAAAIIGSLWAALIALAIAVPTAIAAAIMSTEICNSTTRAWLRTSMEILAGIPSVVYGLLGLWVLLPLLQTEFGLLTGHSLLAAGLLLSVMVLPTIMVMSQDALLEVASSQRDAAAALGMDWNSSLWRVLLPQAWLGIRSGVLLALGRALGETMAVMLVVGSINRVPDPWYNLLQPAQTLTARVGREIGEASFGSIHFAALIACGLLLAATTITISLISNRTSHAHR